MKIGFVLDDRLDKPDGVQQYVTLLGSWLHKQGHDVHYLVGNSPNAQQDNVHNLGRTVSVRFNKNRMAIPLPASGTMIKQILHDENFDILHVQMPYSPLLAGKVINTAGTTTAVVGTFHILPHGKLSSFGTRSLAILVKKSRSRFDDFMSVSSAAQKFAKSHFGIESTVIPNVVDLSKYKTGKPLDSLNGRRNIVFLGRFVERKGAHYLIAAYETLISKYPIYATTTRLVLCGDGPNRNALELQSEHFSKIGAEILFTGFLKESQKKDYLASATLAVFPSTGGESFGIVLIEAMAAGAGAVIGGNNPGYSTVLGTDPEALIDPTNKHEFSELLHKYLSNNSALVSLHDSQQKLVQSFDVLHVGPKIVQFYEEALARRRRRGDN